MSRNYSKSKGNARAQQEITVIIHAATNAGAVLKSAEIAKVLNGSNHSRSFCARRVGCLLRGRDDVEFVSDGVWRPVVPMGQIGGQKFTDMDEAIAAAGIGGGAS